MAQKTATQLVNYALSMVGHPYWYGTYGQIPTEALLNAKKSQFPDHYPSDMLGQRNSDIKSGKTVTDCSGLIKGFGWMDSSGKIIYNSNGIIDTNANGIYTAAKIKGAIKTIPEKPGLGVRKDGHIGVYVGNGVVVEAQGRNYGVVKTNLSARPWTHWLEIPYIDYSGSTISGNASGALGDSALQRGDKGDAVRALQETLVKLGLKLEIDGIFGAQTEAAVKAYQKSLNLPQTGAANTALIRRMLSAATADVDADRAESPQAAAKVEVTGGTVNIRTGPGTQYASVGIAKLGNIMGALANENKTPLTALGWYAVILDGAVRWMSGKYVKVVK